MLALAPEKEADVNVDERGGHVGGKGQELQRVGGGPHCEDHGGADGGNNPKLLARVELRAEKEADARKAEESVVQRDRERILADPGRKTRAKIVQAVEDPGGSPDREDTAGA